MYLIRTTVVNVDELTLEEAKELALEGRRGGYRTEIVSYEEATKRNLFDPNQQDLTKLNAWGDVK